MSSSPPKRTTYAGPPLSGPGIMYTTSRLTSAALSAETFNTWYDTVHIPDLLATGAVSAAYRFKALKPTSDAPYLTICVLPDIGSLQRDEAKFKAVPMTHASLPEGGPLQKFVDIDVRSYKLIQNFEGPGEHPTTWYPALVAAGMEPAAGEEGDLDAWYRKEHLQQATTQLGFKRSTRYKLMSQMRLGEGQQGEPAPSSLALHEWEAGHLGEDVQSFDPVTEWTKKVVGYCTRIEVGNYELIGSFGLK